MNRKYKRLLSDSLLFAISSFASKVISFFLLPLYTSILSTADYGITDLIQTTVNFLYPFLTLSISEATIRFSIEKEKGNKNVLSTSLAFILISVIPLVIVTPFVSRINAELSNYWGFFLAYYLCHNIHYCFAQYTRGCEKVKLFATAGVAHTIVVIASNLLLLLVFKLGVVGYLLSFIIGYVFSILQLIIGGKYIKDIFNIKFDKNLIKEMLKYSIPMIPTQVFWWLNNAADKWVIIAMLGVAENGIYSVAHKIPTVLTMITAIFNKAWQVSAFTNYGQKDNEAFFTNVYSMFTVASIFVGTVFITFSEFFGRILFSNDFYRGWVFVPMLLIAAIFNGITGMLASAFTSAKKTKALFVSTGIGAIVNICLNIPFVKIFGSIGAAYATAISCIVVWCVRIVQTNKYIRIRANYIAHIASFTIIVLQAFLVTKPGMNIWIIGVCALSLLVVINNKELWKVCSSLLQSLRRKKEGEELK